MVTSENGRWLNLPKKDKRIRKIFRGDKGTKIVSLDFSNIEAKMLAYITGDEKFIHAVNSGNLHDINTKALFHIDETDKMWPLARRAAKIFQFGHISYGGSAKAVWEMVALEAPGLGLTLKGFEEAARRYFDHYNRFGEWREEVRKQAINDRVSISPFGRIRWLYGSDRDRIKQAFNHPAQSGAAHVMNTVMVNALRARDEAGLQSRLQVQIYDDLRWECPLTEVDKIVKMTVPIMERPFVINDIERSFTTDIEIGNGWGDLTPVDRKEFNV